jgi:hypothetical protein
MKKRTHQYNLLLESADGSKKLDMAVSNHDDLFNIIEKAKGKDLFKNPAQAEQFVLGLKLFSEVMLKHRELPLFKEFSPAFGTFMKKLKSQ